MRCAWNYWSPDAATRRELAQAYAQAAQASGLRERNVAVERFARAAMNAPPKPAVVPVEVQGATAPATAGQVAGTERKQSRNKATRPRPKPCAACGSNRSPKPCPRRAQRLGECARSGRCSAVAALLALGAALTQWHRHRRPRPAL